MSSQLLVFDLDGTLLDSSKGIQSALQLAISSVDPSLAVPDFTKNIGPPIRKILFQVYGDLGEQKTNAIINEFRRVYDFDTYAQACVYPGVYEALSRLSISGHRLAIFTNKPSRPTISLLAAFDMTRFFEVIVSIDTRSPHYNSKVGMLKTILDHTSSPPSLTTVVGDSPDDAIAAMQWNCRFIKAAYGFGLWDAFPEHTGFAAIHTFPELLEIVNFQENQ